MEHEIGPRGRRFITATEAWSRAAKEHLSKKPGSITHLAIGARAWRELEARDPDWRTKDPADALLQGLGELKEAVVSSDVPAFPQSLHFLKQQTLALIFEEQYKKAFLKKDHTFALRLSKAFLLSEEEIDSPVTLIGSVLKAWDDIYVRRIIDSEGPSQTPTEREIRSYIDSQRRESHLPLMTERHWMRIWRDPFIAALMRCR